MVEIKDHLESAACPKCGKLNFTFQFVPGLPKAKFLWWTIPGREEHVVVTCSNCDYPQYVRRATVVKPEVQADG